MAIAPPTFIPRFLFAGLHNLVASYSNAAASMRLHNGFDPSTSDQHREIARCSLPSMFGTMPNLSLNCGLSISIRLGRVEPLTLRVPLFPKCHGRFDLQHLEHPYHSISRNDFSVEGPIFCRYLLFCPSQKHVWTLQPSLLDQVDRSEREVL